MHFQNIVIENIKIIVENEMHSINVSVYSTVFLTIGTKLYSRSLEFFHLFYFFLAVLCGLWDLSSPTRKRAES